MFYMHPVLAELMLEAANEELLRERADWRQKERARSLLPAERPHRSQSFRLRLPAFVLRRLRPATPR